jgi:hypothetical protein
MPTDIKSDLARLSGKASGKGGTVFCTVIGSKLRDSETNRRVPMEASCPSFVTWCIGVGYAKPSKRQRAAILKFWRATPDAPDTYTWTTGSEPVLKVPKSTTGTTSTINPTEEDI